MALVQFDNLMRQRAVVPHFQPIVKVCNQEQVGYEVLGRQATQARNDSIVACP